MKISGCLRIVVLALSCGNVLSLASPHAVGAATTRTVPKAFCGPQDHTESIQGQTTLAERFRPGPAKAYNCNLELIGQFEGEGTSFDMEVFENCAYYSTAHNPKMRHPGVVVLDVSDAWHPKVTAYLDSPAMLNAPESLEVNFTRKLLLASKPVTTAAAPFDIYDLSGDCRYPVLKSSKVLPKMMSHAGKFVMDGRTFYGTSWDIFPPKGVPIDATLPPLSAVFALDTSNPDPRGLATWIPKEKWKTHSVSVNSDGTRAYVALSWRTFGRAEDRTPNGLVILDVSDVQARLTNPQFRIISTLFWDDTHEAQFTLPVRIKGQPYVIFSDLMGTIGYTRPPPENVCSSGKPSHGFARIIDISDERHPKIVSKLVLEVAEPANCSKVMHDPTALYGYGSLGCDVDNARNSKLLACGYFEGGLRVFDIRDPAHPREIAYYKPPARRTENRPGSLVRFLAWGGQNNYTADSLLVPRFRQDKEISFISSDNGFQIVRFTDAFKASNPELFRTITE